ncbi:MAG: oligosaccharide flippase family protein [Desulfobacter sp.]
MGIASKTINNIISIWATKLFSVASGLILVPVLLSSLGLYDYGLWLTLGQGVSILALLDFGISNSVTRFISKADAEQDKSEKSGVYTAAMLIFSAAGLFSLLLVLLSVNYVPELLNVSTESHKVTKILFLSLGLKLSISFPLRVGRGLLQSKYRYDYIELVGLLSKVANISLTLLLYLLGLIDLYILCAINIMNNFAVEWLIFIKGRKLYPEIGFRLSLVNKARFRALFSLGASSLIQTLAGMLNRKGYIFAISLLFGMEGVPIFTIANNLLTRLGGLIGRIGATFVPLASRAQAKNESETISHLTIFGTRYCLTLGFIFSGYLMIYGKDLVRLWIGHGQISNYEIGIVFQAMMIMLLPVFISRANMGNRSILISTGSHWLVSNSVAVGSAVALIIGVLLMRYTSMGILGGAVGWSLSPLIIEGILFPVFVARQVNISIYRYFLSIFLNPIYISLVVVGLNMGLWKIFVSDSLLVLAVHSFVYSVISLVLMFFFGVESSHRAKFEYFILQKCKK